MGLSVSLLVIEGDQLATLSEIFGAFGYHETGSRREVSRVDEVRGLLHDNRLDRSHFRRAACVVNGWTVIIDPAMVMMWNREACASLSTTSKARLLSMTIQETSGSYAYDYYEGKRVRGFFYQGGEMMETFGKPFDPRSGFAATKLYDVVIRKQMQHLGVNYDDIWAAERYVVLEFESPKRPPARLGENEDPLAEVRKRMVVDLERVAMNDKYPVPLRQKARDALAAMATDEWRAEWLCKLAKEALDRIDTSFRPDKSPVGGPTQKEE